MDNGQLQKEQALRIKRIVGQNNHRRRKSRILHSTCLPFPGMDIMDNKTLEAPTSSLDISSADIPPDISAFNETVLGDWSQFNSWSTDLDISSIIPEEAPLGTELTFDQLGWENGILIGDGSFDGHDPLRSGTSQVSQYSDSVFSPSINISTLQTSGEVANTTLQDGMHRGVTNFSVPETSSIKYPQHGQRPSAIGAMSESPTFSINLEDATSQNEKEDNLLMHYLDEVFHIQFPFYNIPNRRSRSWLFSTIRRTRSVYHATLALSQYLLRSTADTSVSPMLSSNRNHYEMAHREFEVTRGETRQSSTLPRVTCMLQILFYDVHHHFYLQLSRLLKLTSDSYLLAAQGTGSITFGLLVP